VSTDSPSIRNNQLTRSSYDSRNMEAGPSGYTYAEREYPSILPAFRHERSQSRMVLIEPLRTTTQTKIWLDQHYRSDVENGEKGSRRSSSSSNQGSMEKVEFNDTGKDEEDRDDQASRMPFLIRPIPPSIGIGEEDGEMVGSDKWRWLSTEDQATEWLSLFYGTSPFTVLSEH
jgi:hypothetical protein